MKRKKTIQGWECHSSARYVHGSGVRIERKGPPKTKSGWYLVSPDRSVPRMYFAPTPDGFHKALSAFARRKAVIDQLTRLVARD